MSDTFGTISVNSSSFRPVGSGKYLRTGLSFNDPSDHFQIKPGSPNRTRNLQVASVTRFVERVITINGQPEKVAMSVQVVVNVPLNGFEPSDVDKAIDDISDFLTPTNTDLWLLGSS